MDQCSNPRDRQTDKIQKGKNEEKDSQHKKNGLWHIVPVQLYVYHITGGLLINRGKDDVDKAVREWMNQVEHAHRFGANQEISTDVQRVHSMN